MIHRAPSILTTGVLVARLLSSALSAQAFPPVPTPTGNPVTTAKTLLGKTLFWDEQLSSSGSTACGTCHILSAGGVDPRTTAVHPGPDGQFGTPDDRHGSFGVPSSQASGAYAAVPGFGIRAQVTPRRVASMINAAYQGVLFWDGRVQGMTFRDPITNAVRLTDNAQLENLIIEPFVNTIEMGHAGRTWTDVVARVQAVRPLAIAQNVPAALAAFVGSNSYAQLFQQAFGSPGVDAGRVIMAVATYIRTLIADQTRFDRFVAGTVSMTAAEQRGFGVFARNGCLTCHVDIQPFQQSPGVDDFRNTGVRPIAEDRGRAVVSGQGVDDGKFKVPQLRNVALRSRFFHDGSRATLAEVVTFYNRGGDFHVNQDPVMATIANSMSAADQADLVVFLQMLTDQRVQNEQAPFDRPLLWSEGSRVPTVFGTGTPGTGGLAPRCVAIEPPYVGNGRFTLAVDRAVPGMGHALLLDRASHPGQQVAGLTFHLALTGALKVYPAAGLTAGSGANGGYGSMTIAIPASPALVGVGLFGQWIAADPQGPGGVVTSDGFGVTLF